MITLEEAKNLQYGEILVDTAGKRWKVNGKVKLWKRDKTRIYVPLKHGLYTYDYLGGIHFNEHGECDVVTREAVIQAAADRARKDKEQYEQDKKEIQEAMNG